MRSSCKHLVFACFSIVPIGDLHADECTPPSSGPDAITAEIVNVVRFGTVGGVSGYAIGSDLCNVGDAALPWNLGISQNLYRISNGRMEQIGMSWVKRVGIANADSTYCTCIASQDPFILGVGCSDVYTAQMNGNQAGLGPRSSINAFAGLLPALPGGQVSDIVERRLQVQDVVVAAEPDAIFVAEVQLISPDDASGGNAINNVSWKLCTATVSQQTGGWLFPSAGPTVRRQPAILAWAGADSTVAIEPVEISGEGRFYVGSRVSDNGDGTWHYEYAVFNLNSHRSARSFSVPVPTGIAVTNIGFHDIDYHSGEPYDSTDWPGTHEGGAVTWSTDTFETNENANALRWGTLYNFRFDADAPPGSTVATLGLFRPGVPDAVTLVIDGPVVIVPTLSAGGLLLMGGMFATAGWWVLRKANRQAN